MNISHVATQLSAKLAQDGLDAGIAWLNAGVPHRYTAVYRLEGKKLYNVLVYDKQNQLPPDALAVVELDESFCQFVLRDGALLADNSVLDDRLAGSPFQGMVMAYHGVAVADDRGGLYGTLCHFDLVEQTLSDAQFALMQAAGRLLYPYVRELRGGADPKA